MFLVYFLVTALTAACASVTTCQIWEDGDPSSVLAFNTGPTACDAQFGNAHVWATFDGTSSANNQLFVASVRGVGINSDLTPDGVARSVGNVSEWLTFFDSNIPAGSTLILEWKLVVADRVDTSAVVNILGFRIVNTGQDDQGTAMFSLSNGPVEVTADIDIRTSGESHGITIMILGSNIGSTRFSRVVDANGDPVKGFTYSVLSDRPIFIQDGLQVQAIPEPGTALLLIAPLVWALRRRKRSVSRTRRAG